MVVLIDILSGAIGAIIILISIISLPFFRKIIFKLFEAKINEKVEKTLSDYNAKNDTKIHTSKALFDLEQKAINHNLSILAALLMMVIDMRGINQDGYSSDYLRKYYKDKMELIKGYLKKYVTENVLYSVYLPEEIDKVINGTYKEYENLHKEIGNCLDNVDKITINTYLDDLLKKIEKDNKRLSKIIREYYSNIKIV